MRKKTFSEEQIALALRDAETGTPPRDPHYYPIRCLQNRGKFKVSRYEQLKGYRDRHE